MQWFKVLMPKEERFFDLFEQHSKVVVAGAEALRLMLDGGDAVSQYYKTVMERESDADAVTREVLMAVRRTFITPFDRGNIKDLITAMDNSIDQMQKTAKGVMLFNLHTFTPHMREMGDVIVKSARLVEEVMPMLRSVSAQAARVSAIAEQISHLEGRADDLHDAGLKTLYEETAAFNPMAFITGRDIYDHLEKVVDRFDDVANEIQGIVIDHV